MWFGHYRPDCRVHPQSRIGLGIQGLGRRRDVLGLGHVGTILRQQTCANCTTGVWRIITEVIFGLFGQNVFLIGVIIFLCFF